MALLQEIQERFSPEEDEFDMCILYETTGYRIENDERTWRIWENYRDIEQLGESNLVRDDKDEQIKASGA